MALVKPQAAVPDLLEPTRKCQNKETLQFGNFECFWRFFFYRELKCIHQKRRLYFPRRRRSLSTSMIYRVRAHRFVTIAQTTHSRKPVSKSSHLPHILSKPKIATKKVRIGWRQCNTSDTVRSSHTQAQRTSPRLTKIRIILILLRRVVSEIKLKRTDTTLDLSQKLLKDMRLAKCSKRFGSWRGRGGETNAKRAEEILGEDQAGKSIVIYLW